MTDEANPNRDETKQALLRAAIKVFAQKGYAAATVREICQIAQANVAAVNYHYRDKESLYAAVLDYMFVHSKEHGRGVESPPPGASAKERLFFLIKRSLYEIYGYHEGEEDDCAELSSIFLLEMAQPSKNLDGLVESYIRPDVTELYGLVAEIMGRNPADDLVKDASACIMGQVMFYTVSWPIITRLDPTSPPQFRDLDHWADIIIRFSLAGLANLSQKTT